MPDSAACEQKCEKEKMMLPEFLRGWNPKEGWTFSDKYWRNQHPARLHMTYSFLPKFLDPSQEWGITEPNENEISHSRVSWQTDWTYFVMGTLASSTA